MVEGGMIVSPAPSLDMGLLVFSIPHFAHAALLFSPHFFRLFLPVVGSSPIIQTQFFSLSGPVPVLNKYP
jgi:hypothetical protein